MSDAASSSNTLGGMTAFSTPIATTSNRFNALQDQESEMNNSFLGASDLTLPPLPDEHPLPDIPDIPNIDKLNETQKTFLMLQMADKLGLKPTR